MTNDKRYTTEQAAALLSRLMRIREASVPQARRLFAELLAARLGDVVVNPRDALQRESDERVAGLQKGVYAYLHLAPASRVAPDKHVWPDVQIKNVTLQVGGPGPMRVEVSGELNKLLTVQVYNLLRVAGSRIKQCECGQLFVRVRRQITCSTKCQKRFYMRKYRSGEAGGLE